MPSSVHTLHFLGCGDAFSNGARGNTCLLVRGELSTFLIDCGATALYSLRQHQVDPRTIDAIYLSHLHGDHFGGIPALLLEAKFQTLRRRPLTIVGPPGVAERVRELQEVLYPGMSSLPLEFELRFLEYEPGVGLRIGDVTVTPHRVVHSQNLDAFGLRFDLAGRVLAFSGDTEWTDSLPVVARSADLFVCECYSFDEPIPGHLNYRTLCEHRAELECDRLVLTHLGDTMLANLGRVREEIAFDGLVVTL